MRLISFDPSSTCTGWAVMEPIERLLACGKIVFPHKAVLVDRLELLRVSVLGVLGEHEPQEAVIEIPSARAWNKGGGYGLAGYGMAVGVVLGACWQALEAVHTVTEDKWTGRQPKEKRLMLVKALYAKEYSRHQDLGLDISDAIALGNWFLANKRISEASKGLRA